MLEVKMYYPESYSAFLQNPSNPSLFEKVKTQLLEKKDFPKLLEIYQLHSQHQTEKKLSHYLETAKIAKDCKQFDEAFQFCQAAIEIDKNYIEAIDLAIEILQQQQKWEKLIELLKKKNRLLKDPNQKAENFYQIAKIHKKLGNLSEQQSALNQTLLFKENHIPALQELEKIFRQTESWEMLAGVLSSKLELLQEPHEILALQKEIAQIWDEKLSNLKQAIQWYSKIIYEHPKNWEILRRMEEITFQKDWEQYIRAKSFHAAELEDPKEKAKILKSIADIWQKELDNPTRAVSYLQRAFQLDPQNKDVLHSLVQLYQQLHCPENLKSILPHYAKTLEKNSPQQAEAYLQLAELQENPKQALQYYHQAIPNLPYNKEAFQEAKKLCYKLEDWPKLIDILQKESEYKKNPEEQSQIYFEIAEIFYSSLQKSQKALEYFKKTLDLNPHNQEAFTKISDILQELEDYPQLQRHLLRWLEHTQEPSRRFLILLDLALLHSFYLPEKKKVIHYLQKALEICPYKKEIFLFYTNALEKSGEYQTLFQSWKKQYLLLSDPFYCLKAAHTSLKYNLYTKETIQLLEENYTKFPQLPEIPQLLASLYQKEGETQKALLLLEETTSKLPLQKENVPLHLQLALLHYDQKNVPACLKILENLLLHFPQSPQILETCQRIYQAEKNYLQLALLFQTKAQHAANKTDAAQNLYSAAKIYLYHLNEKHQATQLLHQALEHSLQIPEIWHLLEQIYQEEKNFDNLQNLYEELEQRLPSSKDKITLLWKYAQFLEKKHPEKAIQKYEKILTLQPLHQQALEKLSDFYFANGLSQKAVDALETLLQVCGEKNPQKQREIFEKLATIYHKHFSLPQKAIPYYQKALELSPQNLSILDTLLELGLATSTYSYLPELLAHKATLVQDKDFQCKLYKQAAEIAKEQLQDLSLAAQYYQQAHKLSPQNLEILDQLHLLLYQKGKWREVTQILEKKLSLYLQQQKGELLLKTYLDLAKIHQQHLFDLNKAAEYYKQALSIDFSNPTALQNLKIIYTHQEKWQKLLELHQERIEESIDIQDTVESYMEIAQIYHHYLQDYEKAKEAYSQALHLQKNNQNILEKLSHLLKIQKKYDELLTLYQQHLSPPPSKQAEIHFQMGCIFQFAFGDIQKAKDTFSKAIQLHPPHLPSWQALEKILIEQSQWEELISLLEKKILNLPSQKVETYFKIAQIYWKKLQNFQQALHFAQKILEENSHHLPTLRFIQEALETQKPKNLPLMENVLQKELDIASQKERKVHILFTLAKINYPKYPKKAENYLWQALYLEPSNMAVFEQLAKIYQEQGEDQKRLNLYRKFIPHIPDNGLRHKVYVEMANLLPPEEKQEIQQALQEALKLQPTIPILQQLKNIIEDPQEKIKILNIALALPLKPQEATQYRLELAKLLCKKEKYEEATSLVQEVLIQDPNQKKTVLPLLQKIYRSQENWKDYLQILKQQLQQTKQKEEKIQILTEMAHTSLKELYQPLEAAKYYWEILNLAPLHPEACKALESILTQFKKWSELAQLYEQMAKHQQNFPQKAQTLLRLGQLYHQHLQKPNEAIQCLEHSLHYQPSQEAISTLTQLYKDTKHLPKLASILQLQAKNAQTPDEKIRYLQQSAELLERKLDHPKAAAETWEKVLKIQPQNPQALSSLSRLYEKLELWEKLAQNLQLQLQISTQKNPKTYFQLARIYKDKLLQPIKSISFWEKGLELDPENYPELEEFLSTCKQAQETAAAIRFLEKSLASACLERKNWIEQELAQLYIDVYEYEKALIHLENLYQRLPDNPEVFDQYRNILTLLGYWQKLETVLQNQLKQLPTKNTKTRRNLLHLLGELMDKKLNRPLQAIKIYEELWQLYPNDKDTIQALKILYRSLLEWKKLANVYEQELKLVEEKNERLRLLKQLAEIYRYGLNDWNKSLQTLEHAWELAPQDWQILTALEELYTKLHRQEDLANLLQKASLIAPTREEKARYLLAQANIAYRYQKDSTKALSLLKKAIQLEEKNTETLKLLQTITLEIELWEEYLTWAERYVKQLPPTQRPPVYLQMAKVYQQQKNAPEIAIEYLERLLEIDPTWEEAYQLAKKIYSQLKLWKDCVRLLEKKITALLPKKNGVKIAKVLECKVELAKIYWQKLNNPEKALEVYQSALMDDPNCPEAIRDLAKLQIQRKEYSSAAVLLERWLNLEESRYPQEAENIRLELAELYLKMENTPAAIDHLNAAIQLNPAQVNARKQLAELYLKLGNIQKSYDHFRQLANLLPKDTSLLETLSQFSLQLEKFADLENYSRAILLEKENHPMAWNWLAKSLQQQGKLQEAAQAYLRHLQLHKQNPQNQAQTHLNLGKLHQFQLQDPSTALEHYSQAIQKDPSSTEAHQCLLELAALEEKHSIILQYCPELIKKIEDPKLKVKYQIILAKSYYFGNSNPQLALEILNEILQENKLNLQALELKYSILEHEQKWQEASQVLQKILAYSFTPSQKISAHFRLADLYENKLYALDRTIFHYKQILELDPNRKEAQIALARLYPKVPSYKNEAEHQILQLIQNEPWQVEYYLPLLTHYEEEQKEQKWFAVAEILKLFGNLPPLYHGKFQELQASLTYPQQRIFPHQMEKILGCKGENPLLGALLREIGGELSKLFPPKIATKYNLKRKQPIKNTDHYLSQLQENFTKVFGEVEVKLHEIPEEFPQLYLEYAPTPYLIATQGFASLPEEQRRFLFAAKMALIFKDASLLAALNQDEFQLLVEATCYLYSPQTNPSSPTSQDLAKKIKSLLSRKIRRNLENLLSQIQETFSSNAPPFDAKEFYQATFASAFRFGLLFSNSLQAAVEGILTHFSHHLKKQIPPEKENPQNILPHSPILQQLLLFHLNKNYLELKKNLEIKP
ncbi:MAG: hypothetical protein D6805_00880 [Planctomycetota bacterium]|nr:MAG: hypothetical protein D6805_00880 [Planctomycetota bacterium]